MKRISAIVLMLSVSMIYAENSSVVMKNGVKAWSDYSKYIISGLPDEWQFSKPVPIQKCSGYSLILPAGTKQVMIGLHSSEKSKEFAKKTGLKITGRTFNVDSLKYDIYIWQNPPEESCFNTTDAGVVLLAMDNDVPAIDTNNITGTDAVKSEKTPNSPANKSVAAKNEVKAPIDPTEEGRENLMIVNGRPVKNIDDWAKRRAHIIANVETVTGIFPGQEKNVPLDVKVLEKVELAKVTRQKITYTAESGDRVPAYLFIPTKHIGKLPAMICLHQTYGNGKDEPSGISGSPNLYYALELAERGYVTLAPDCPPFGENKSNAYDLGYESVTMKAIWNHKRGVDLLASLPEVNPDAIGSIGHSHGGFNTLMLRLFDDRIKVAVISCGFTTFRLYNGGTCNLSGFSQKIYYMPKIQTLYDNSPDKVPFDFPEIIAALAPCPLFINSPMQDSCFQYKGVDRCVTLAKPVYKLFDAEQNIVVAHPPGGHDFPTDVRMEAYKFIDKVLKTGKSQP